MFEKSLQDLVKALRAVKGDAAPVIAKAIQEIKDELKNRDVVIKAQALQKLCYVRFAAREARRPIALQRGAGWQGAARPRAETRPARASPLS